MPVCRPITARGSSADLKRVSGSSWQWRTYRTDGSDQQGRFPSRHGIGGETATMAGVSNVRAASDSGLPLRGVKPGGGRGTSGVRRTNPGQRSSAGVMATAAQRWGRHSGPLAHGARGAERPRGAHHAGSRSESAAVCRSGVELKIIAFIERHQTEVVEKTLRHCGLWEEQPPRGPPPVEMSIEG